MDTSKKLIDKLCHIVGTEHAITDPSHLDEVSWDALSAGRIHPQNRPAVSPPLCLVLPASTGEVRAVVLLANEEKVPVVVYGGGSGLMGGALSLRPGIALDLRRMNEVLQIDKEARTATVQAGMVLESLEKQLSEKGFILGHDPWTLPVATVGGAISTNSMGYRGGKYGSMGDQLLGLEAVLPNGEILRTRSVPKSSAGINLKHLFVGGEGCFGIITEATLRVFPVPERRSLSAFLFNSFEHGFLAIQKIFGRGLKPALVDFGDDIAKADGRGILYLGFEGPREMVGAEEQLTLAICAEGGGKRLPQEEAERFWRERHVIAYHFMHHRHSRREPSRDGIRRDWIHVALPASGVLEFREAATEIIARNGVTLQESGLWTQPELFSMRLAIESENMDHAQQILQDTVDELLRLVQKMGGSMEYCHGVGVKLAPHMAREHGYGLEVMRQIKRTIDPNNIMNPGKMGL